MEMNGAKVKVLNRVTLSKQFMTSDANLKKGTADSTAPDGRTERFDLGELADGRQS